jgi:hypothetical protein
VRFSPGGFSGGPVVYRQAVNTTQECQMGFGRTLRGARSNQNFYGYSGGEISLPNRRGGMLTFRYWNDQNRGRGSTSNNLVVQIDEQSYFFRQYSTPLDLEEFYTDMPNEWGPAGGSLVRLQVPPGIGRVQVSNPGSEAGIELSEVHFATGAVLGHDFVYEEHVNWTDRTFNTFGRTLTGQRSGKKFFGYSGGTIFLPHRKGGRLSFTVWNDQNRSNPAARNFVRYNYANLRVAAVVKSTNSALSEFYAEMPNEWGPGGGRALDLDIPPGVSHVDLGNEGSETGVEISDIVFRSRPSPSTHMACTTASFQPPNPPPPPPQPVAPVTPIRPSEPATPEVTPTPPATPEVVSVGPPGGGSKVISDNWNTAACGFTDNAVMNLSQPTHADRVDLWYNWSAGETSLPYTLSSGSRVLRHGAFRRGSCDPYQTAWCEALDTINMDLPAGSYTFRATKGRLCQNPGSRGMGMIRVYGRVTGAVTVSPPATPEVKPAAPATPEVVPAARAGAVSFDVIQVEGGIRILDPNKPHGILSVGGGAMRFTQGGKEILAFYTRDIKEIDVNSVLSIKTASFHVTLVSGRTLNFYVPSLKVDDCVRIVNSLRQALR